MEGQEILLGCDVLDSAVLPCQAFSSWSACAYVTVGVLIMRSQFLPGTVHASILAEATPIRYLNAASLAAVRFWFGLCVLFTGLCVFMHHSCMNLFNENTLVIGRLDQLALLTTLLAAVFMATFRLALAAMGGITWLHKKNTSMLVLTFCILHPLTVGVTQRVLTVYQYSPTNLYLLLVMATLFIDVTLPVLLGKLWAKKYTVRTYKRRLFTYLKWTIFTLGSLVLYLDLQGYLCHLTTAGHAIWHLCGAVGCYLSFHSYITEVWWSTAYDGASEQLRMQLQRHEQQHKMLEDQLEYVRTKTHPYLYWLRTQHWEETVTGVFVVACCVHFALITYNIRDILLGRSELLNSGWIPSATTTSSTSSSSSRSPLIRDASDPYWEAFRSGLPLLLVAGVLFSLCTTLLSSLVRDSARVKWLCRWYALAGIFMLWYLFGTLPAASITAWILSNFRAMNHVVIQRKHAIELIEMGKLSPSSRRNSTSDEDEVSISKQNLIRLALYNVLVFAVLYTQVQGTLGQNTEIKCVLLNATLLFTLMRMLGFNSDYARIADDNNMSLVSANHTEHCKMCQQQQVCHVRLQEFPLPLKSFTHPSSYCSYLLYPPLLLCGPLLSFNAYMSFVLTSQFSLKRAVMCMLRWIGAFLLLELFFHLCLTHAVFSEGLYNNAGMPTEVFRSSVISTVFALQYSWWVGNAFKIAAIFGFARTWAVVNGMVPPAMRIRERFPQSLTSILTCWKSTHYSLYLWVIRYIYVPLGGKKHRFSRNYLTAASGVLLGYMIVWSQWANGYAWLVALALLMLSWLASIVTRRMASIRNMQRGKSREGKLFALGLHIFALPIIVMGSLVSTTILFFNANPDVYYQLVQPALAAESALQTVQSALLTFSFFVAATHWANRINLRRWRNQGDDAPILPESMYSSDSEI